MAASSIANIVKSSLGPVGLDKMLVDDIGVSSIFYQYLRTCNWSDILMCLTSVSLNNWTKLMIVWSEYV